MGKYMNYNVIAVVSKAEDVRLFWETVTFDHFYAIFATSLLLSDLYYYS